MQTSIESYPEFFNALRHNELVYLFGTGISAALTGELYGWGKWISDGIAGLANRNTAKELEEALKASGSTNNTVLVAGRVIAAAKADGTYDSWMKASFERNPITNYALAATMKKLAAANDVFATTNYDCLLEQATGLQSLSYEDTDRAFAMLENRHATAVLHIHGIYDSRSGIDNIIGGKEQYDAVLGDKGAQFIQNILGTKTLVFIGCGKTTEDSNISQFVLFAKNHLKLDRSYYFLCRSGELPDGLPENIHPIPYGDNRCDLPPFLEEMARVRLSARAEHSRLVGRTLFTEHSTDIYGLSEYHYANEYLKFCGRKRELGQLHAFLECDSHILWWAVTGQGGAGKSRLAYESMKHMPVGFFAFFLASGTDVEDAAQFCPFCDTLVIVDYVLGNEERIARIIDALCDTFEQEENRCFKLRLLLLERENLTTSGTWYNTLEQDFHYDARSRFHSAEYRANPSVWTHDFLYLDDLDRDAVLELIANVCERHDLPADSQRDRTLMDEYEKKFEQLRFRPLFLQVFVQAWIKNGQTNIDYHSYWDLLNAVLDREEERLLHMLGKDTVIMSALLRLLARACVSPLDASRLPESYIGDWICIEQYIKKISLPGVQRKERLKSLYKDASQDLDVSENGDAVIDPQYPDIIKEAFFLRYVDDLAETGRELWENAADAFAMFLYRCVVDFPNSEELADYLRRETVDCQNTAAMHSRIALLHHDIITIEDDIEKLNRLIDTEFAFWRSVGDEHAEIKLEGLYAAAEKFLGWNREDDMYEAIDCMVKLPSEAGIQRKKQAYLHKIVRYLTENGAYAASNRVLDSLLEVKSQPMDVPDAHWLDLIIRSERILNTIGLIRTQPNGEYRDEDWEEAVALLDDLEAACDLKNEADAEIYSCTAAECTKLAVHKLGGGFISDFSFRMQDYAVRWAEERDVAFNDRIQYNYLLSKYHGTEAVAVASALKGANGYAIHLIDDYIRELSGNEMIQDFSGLLVGAWAMKVAYDESVTDAQAQDYRQKAGELLRKYPDSDFLCARYMELIWCDAKEQHRREVSTAEIAECYPLLLRFPNSEEVLHEFFKLLEDSAEQNNWFKYLRNKGVVSGLIHNRMGNYLFGPPGGLPMSKGTYIRPYKKVGVNDPCPCGSGKKFKKCCRGNGRYD